MSTRSNKQERRSKRRKCIERLLKKRFMKYLIGTTVGAVLILSITITILFAKSSLHSAFTGFFVLFIIVDVLAGSLFIFSMYAYKCGKQRAKMILAWSFIIYGAICVIGAIVLFISKSKLISKILNIFNDADLPDEVKTLIEDKLKCCETEKCHTNYPDRGNCQAPVESFINSLTLGSSPALLLLAALLFLGAYICYLEKQKMDKEEQQKYVSFQEDTQPYT